MDPFPCNAQRDQRTSVSPVFTLHEIWLDEDDDLISRQVRCHDVSLFATANQCVCPRCLSGSARQLVLGYFYGED
jgi:hypothetical protein